MSSRVPPVPSVSPCAQFRPRSCPLVSSCILLVPRMRDTSVTRRAALGFGTERARHDAEVSYPLRTLRPYAARACPRSICVSLPGCTERRFQPLLFHQVSPLLDDLVLPLRLAQSGLRSPWKDDRHQRGSDCYFAGGGAVVAGASGSVCGEHGQPNCDDWEVDGGKLACSHSQCMVPCREVLPHPPED